jgi:putative DNA primase/helicase
VLLTARSAKNGEKFSVLYDRGEWEAQGFSSQSEADLWLVSRLAYWTNRDSGRMDSLFRRSQLMRDKWERADYRDPTIKQAIRGCKKTYQEVIKEKEIEDVLVEAADLPRFQYARKKKEFLGRLKDLGESIGTKDLDDEIGSRRIHKHNQEAQILERNESRAALSANNQADAYDPRGLASRWLKARHSHKEGRTLHRWNQHFWTWRNGAYQEWDDEDVRSKLANFLGDDLILLNRAGLPVAVNKNIINDTVDAVRSIANLSSLDHHPPCWINAPRNADHQRFVAVKNGLLNLSTRKLIAPTPRWFSFSSLSTSYDEKATCPQWLAFLDEIFPDQQDVETNETMPGQQSRDTLQEFFGYFLTTDMRQQKALIIKGPKRSGKGTIGRILASLIGPRGTVHPALMDFGLPFGLEKLIGKSVAIISDARVDNRVSQAVLAERILAITGEDTIAIARKFLADYTGELFVRFVFLTNELPNLHDASGALPNRFIILETIKSFFGREDLELYDRLATELPGILNWALDGWLRLQERGHFVQPTAAQPLRDELDSMANPLLDFIREACSLPKAGEVFSEEVNVLHRCYTYWCRWRNEPPTLRPNIFSRNLCAAMPGIRQGGRHGNKRRIYGICANWKAIGLSDDPGPDYARHRDTQDEEREPF